MEAWEQNEDNRPRTKEMDIIHLPDIRFVTFCFESFGLNRGIYNTMDQWLYESGYANIMQRRHILISFLNEMKGRYDLYKGRAVLRFGKGGLTKHLNEFLERNKAAFEGCLLE